MLAYNILSTAPAVGYQMSTPEAENNTEISSFTPILLKSVMTLNTCYKYMVAFRTPVCIVTQTVADSRDYQMVQ